MAIGRRLFEGLTDAVIFTTAPKIWDFLKKMFGHPVVQEQATEIVKKVMSSKGLTDESLFSELFAMANTPKSKKIIFQRAINLLEISDKQNDTKYISNFRMIIAIKALEKGLTTITDRSGKRQRVIDRNYIHAGITVLEDMAKRCETETDFVFAIMATGAMQDTPFGTLDELKHWARKTALPAIIAALANLETGLVTRAKDLEDSTKKRQQNFAKLSWLKKLLFNY